MAGIPVPAQPEEPVKRGQASRDQEHRAGQRQPLGGQHARYGDPAFAPVPLLAEHAAAGIAFRA